MSEGPLQYELDVPEVQEEPEKRPVPAWKAKTTAQPPRPASSARTPEIPEQRRSASPPRGAF